MHITTNSAYCLANYIMLLLFVSGLKRAPSTDISLSGDEFTTYKKPLTDAAYTSQLSNRCLLNAAAVCHIA